MRTISRRARLAVVLLLALAVLAVCGCSKKSKGPTGPPVATRPYRMGFSALPPTLDFSALLATLQMWTPRADAALILNEVPWDSLLDGVPAPLFVQRNHVGLADYYRGSGLRIVASIDPCNGLDRSADSAPLVARGHSLTETAMQDLYRDYVVALDTIIHPDYISLASETNLMRAIAPAPLYAALKQNAASAAAAIRAVDPNVKLFTTVQVDVAWGALAGGVYQGIAQDRADFAFQDALGLSAYPYLAGVEDPDSLPLDFYSRLNTAPALPLLKIEGGWSSTTVSAVATDAAEQQRAITREADLLERAGAVMWFQITFTDLDLAVYPAGVAPFAYLGLVDKNLVAKPALSAWDAVFAKPRR
jgi:hypothetical protein